MSDLFKIEEISITLCVKINLVVWLVKGIRKKQVKKKKMPNSVLASMQLFHTVLYWEWVQGWAVILDCALFRPALE